jgi:hypothetical protein
MTWPAKLVGGRGSEGRQRFSASGARGKGEEWKGEVGKEAWAPSMRCAADTCRRRPATIGHLTLNVWIKIEIMASMTDWQGKFNDDYLLNQLDLAKVDNSKVVELHECYNFSNWSLA